MQYLNLGCGQRYRSGWVNVNFASVGEGVVAHDLRRGVPFSDESFDMVYHSHVLEHLTKAEAEPFMRECHRVLRFHGIIRVVVPDLEKIAALYLRALEQASCGSSEWNDKYHWILLEMYDQAVRVQSGGEMVKFLATLSPPGQEFVVNRCGVEIENIMHVSQKQVSDSKTVYSGLFEKVKKRVCGLCLSREYRYKAMLRRLLTPEDYAALTIGRFRQSGEIHQWMYDRYSLLKILEKVGFSEIIQRKADESYVANWSGFGLDTQPDGSIYKPDSIYMEAIKLG